MNKQELEFILQEGEGYKIEFKEGFDAKVEFENLKTGFLVTFFRKQEDGGINGGISERVSSEKSSEKVLTFIKGNPEISAEEIAFALGLTRRAIEKNISKLKKKGILRRVGPDKGGYWEIDNNKWGAENEK